MFLYNNDKKNMAKVINFLVGIKETYRSEINIIENEMLRNNKIIEESRANLQDIKSSFDSSYMVLSSSQVAMSNEYAEIDSLQEIINNREMELSDLQIRKEEIMSKLLEVEEIIMCANSVRELMEEKSFT